MKPGPTVPNPFMPLWRKLASGWAGAAISMGLALQVAPAHADIWGYIDAQGVPHFSSFQVDERYEIFLRERSEPEPYRVQPFAALPSVNPDAPEVAPSSPRMLIYFEGLPSYRAVQHLLREASTKHGIDYALLQALIATESGFDSRAVSPKGAVGLMQLIPPTAERYGVRAGKDSIEKKLTDPVINIRAGANYLSDLIKMFPGQIELALAAYNAGEGAVQRAGNKIPNYPETKNYVKNVMQLYGHLKPPASAGTQSAASPLGRVRIEMSGGSSGRGNMVSPAPQSALPVRPLTAQN